MIATTHTTPLFDESGTFQETDRYGRTMINESLSFVDQAGVRVVFRWHEPLYRFALSDILSMRFVAVSLRLGQLVTQEEVSQSFGHSVATQRRWENRFQKQGIEGLQKKKSSGRPCSVPETCDSLLRKWFAQGIRNAEMARRLAVSDSVIHRALARLGLRRRPPASVELPWPDDDNDSPIAEQLVEEELAVGEEEGEEAEDRQETINAASSETSPRSGDEVRCEPLSKTDDEAGVGRRESLSESLAKLAGEGFTIDQDPDDRFGDRGLARLGQLDDAVPLFGDRPCLRQAGVLLAVPLLVKSGLLDVFSDIYHSLGPAFYGLRTTLVVLFLSALLRIKRPEHFKEHNPRELGHVVGLDRAPEVKTVRRKLTALASRGLARELMKAMAQRRIDEVPERVAFLYVDGHVREYHDGHALAKARNIVLNCLRGSWIWDLT